MDVMDDALLGADDDLDYDLEQEEEEALLADPDNYDENHESVQDEQHYEHDDNYANQENEQETSEDVLDIDAGVDEIEIEKVVGGNQQNTQINQQVIIKREEDDDENDVQTGRNRFVNERSSIQISRQLKTEIPDSLDNVSVRLQPPNNNNQRNGRFRGNRGRNIRGRYNNYNNRGPVFERMGNTMPTEGKTVLINPHFRGNVQVKENARLVWDANNQNMVNQQRYPPQQQIPFQAQQPSPWINQPPNYEPQNPNNFNHQQFHMQQPYVETQQPVVQQYIQPPELMNMNIRPPLHINNQLGSSMTNWNEESSYNNSIYQQQGSFRGREVRFQQPANNQTVMMNSIQNFNQQQQGRNNFNQPQRRPPYQTQVIQQPVQNYPPPNQQFDQQPPPQIIPQNQYQQNSQFVQPNYQHQQFNQMYEPYQNQFNSNQFQGPSAQFQVSNQTFPAQNYNQTQGNNYVSNSFNSKKPEQYHSQQFIRNNTTSNRGNRHQNNFNQNNRTPPKRRSFENKTNQAPNDRDLSKKKKRSMEFSNLHEVPTVDMPDTTTEDKFANEDEETKNYRKKIEEQKRLREKILQEKEERRKLAAAQKAAQQSENVVLPSSNSLINTIKTNPQNLQIKPKFVQKKQVINQQQGQQRNVIKPLMQQVKKPQRIIQRRVNNQNQPTNILITQKNEQAKPKRIVMMKQPTATSTSQQQTNRRVVLKGLNNTEITTSTSISDKSNDGLGSFLSNRTVIANCGNSVDLGKGLIDTPIVVVSNLAAGTTDVKIRKLCQGLGPVQNIQMIPNSRQATIRFKNIISAHNFYKKYQRKMIDLSMIQVSLEALS